MIPLMGPEQRALAALAEDVGQALIRYAERLRATTSPTQDEAELRPLRTTDSPTTSVPSASAAEAEHVDVRLRRLGVSQKKTLEAVRAAGRAGVTANQVAVATGLTSTNTPRMLKTLAERGLVRSRGSNPMVWYFEET